MPQYPTVGCCVYKYNGNRLRVRVLPCEDNFGPLLFPISYYTTNSLSPELRRWMDSMPYYHITSAAVPLVPYWFRIPFLFRSLACSFLCALYYSTPLSSDLEARSRRHRGARGRGQTGGRNEGRSLSQEAVRGAERADLLKVALSRRFSSYSRKASYHRSVGRR